MQELGKAAGGAPALRLTLYPDTYMQQDVYHTVWHGSLAELPATNIMYHHRHGCHVSRASPARHSLVRRRRRRVVHRERS